MIQSRYTAKSGLISLQQRLDTIGNNVANLNTVGFKGSRADFKTLMASELERPVQPQDGLNLDRGVGTTLGATTKSFLPGVAVMTNYPLDMMIQGDAFFALQENGGEETYYTRAGKFALSVEDDGNYLVTPDGYYVLDVNNARINLQNISENELVVKGDGTIYHNVEVEVTDPETGEVELQTRSVPLAQVGLHSFMNRQGLESVGANKFIATEASGEAEADTTGSTILQGYQEGSNVDLATEMTRLIRTQRAFSLVSRALTTADEMDHQANTIRR